CPSDTDSDVKGLRGLFIFYLFSWDFLPARNSANSAGPLPLWKTSVKWFKAASSLKTQNLKSSNHLNSIGRKFIVLSTISQESKDLTPIFNLGGYAVETMEGTA
ncbi:MAG TPA: hypothetical protein PK759_06510, partial [Spirochaetales bacterium]|nr:hypothetical protein [Spirochaetales bacterium]